MKVKRNTKKQSRICVTKKDSNVQKSKNPIKRKRKRNKQTAGTFRRAPRNTRKRSKVCNSKPQLSVNGVIEHPNITKTVDKVQNKKKVIRRIVEVIPKYNSHNCSEDPFPSWKPDKIHWNKLHAFEYEPYLPPFKESFAFKVQLSSCNEDNQPWQVLQRLNSCRPKARSTSSMIFAGGPVWCTAWCPNSKNQKCEQYIALTTAASENSSLPESEQLGLIQIWNCTKVQRSSSTPQLALAITHNHGKVWDLVWCPNGKFEEPHDFEDTSDSLPKLGLLALACEDGFIRIFCIPHPKCFRNESVTSCFYATSPTVVLKQSLSHVGLPPCTSMSWSRTEQCRHIAAGYGDGIIRLFYMRPTSKPNGNVFFPFSTHQAHGTYVLSLCFAPFCGGRWLASCSLDKTIKVWDIQETGTPTFTKRLCAQKIHWIPGLKGFFAVYEFSCGHSSVHHLVPEGNNHTILLSHNAPGRGFDVSEKARICVHSDFAGEVTATHVNRHHPAEQLIVPDPRIPIFRTELVDDDNECVVPIISRRSTNARRTTRIVFKDVYVNDPKKITKEEMLRVRSPLKMNAICVDSYNLMAINHVTWNPNYGYEDYLFTAGESGLCRLLHLPNLTSTPK